MRKVQGKSQKVVNKTPIYRSYENEMQKNKSSKLQPHPIKEKLDSFAVEFKPFLMTAEIIYVKQGR